MNELYYMGLGNCDDSNSNCYYENYQTINYPEYALNRVNTMFANENEGFLKGNIETNTYKPYKSYKVGNIIVNNDRDRLLLEIQMYGFYLTDLGLYLDMHPQDKQALKLFNETREKYYKKVADFDNRFYPLNSFHSNKTDTYEWLEGKFPWVRGN